MENIIKTDSYRVKMTNQGNKYLGGRSSLNNSKKKNINIFKYAIKISPTPKQKHIEVN